jgi:hypothetical protein
MKRTLTSSCVAVSLLLMVAAAVTASAAPTRAIRGSIALSGEAIYRRYPDGHVRQLTTGKFDQFAAWSWDGTQIAFERYDLPDTHCPLLVMNSDGSGVHQVGQVKTDSSGAT